MAQVGGLAAPLVVWVGVRGVGLFPRGGRPFIPGAFVGAACFFGNGTIRRSTLISLVAGAVLAYASERLGDVLARPAAQPRLEGA